MTSSRPTLYYIHDPMCCWCWGFRPTWQRLSEQVGAFADIVYIVGGLAEDSKQPMPETMQQALAATWHRIEQHIPGTQFNFNFWDPASNTQPVRSTYPSCRAVLAAKNQGIEFEQAMILAIQKGYYLKAQNPSYLTTLSSLAADIGLNKAQFEKDIASTGLEHQLQQQLQQARQLSNQGFPSLVLEHEGKLHPIPLDYNHSRTMHQAVMALIN